MLTFSILSVLVTLSVIAAAILPSVFASPKEAMTSFLHKQADVLPQAIADTNGRYINRQDADSKALQSAFRAIDLRAIDGRNDDGMVYFTFDWTFRFGETTIMLIYIPVNKYPSPKNNDQKLVLEDDHTWRWEGGGINGEGYIDVERLAEKWFYVESYYPT